jgi:hypothetical protein
MKQLGSVQISPHRALTLQMYVSARWSRCCAAGYSLVPLADVFNHKAAYVRLTGDYVVAGDVPSSDGE